MFSYNVIGDEQQTAPGIRTEPIKTTPAAPKPPAPEPDHFEASATPIGSGVAQTPERDVTDPRVGARAKVRR
jgi:hypothetical protein